MTPAQAVGRAGTRGARLAECFRTDPRLFVRAVFWRSILPVLRRTVPVRTLVRWMGAKAASGPSNVPSRHARVNTVRRLLAHGGRLVISGNCLERSLLLYRFLGEANAAPQLVMGVSRVGASVEGHAWIELDGEPLGDSTTARFVPILRFGGDLQPGQEPCEHA